GKKFGVFIWKARWFVLLVMGLTGEIQAADLPAQDKNAGPSPAPEAPTKKSIPIQPAPTSFLSKRKKKSAPPPQTKPEPATQKKSRVLKETIHYRAKGSIVLDVKKQVIQLK